MSTLICDLDGVVYLGDQAIAGSGAALRRFSGAGWNLVFCTNNATRTPAQAAAKIRRVSGFPAASQQVVTSAQAAATLIGPEDVAYVLGGVGLMEAVAESAAALTEDWRKASVVAVGLDPELSYDRLSGAVLAIGAGARFVASNHDATYPTPEGLRPGAGAIVAAVSHATGVEPVVAGKPHAAMRKLLAARADDHTWIVGDRDDTDIAMGRAAGWKTARVSTGVQDSTHHKPDVAVPDLAALADHLLA